MNASEYTQYNLLNTAAYFVFILFFFFFFELKTMWTVAGQYFFCASLSVCNVTASAIVQPHQSAMSLDHLLTSLADGHSSCKSVSAVLTSAFDHVDNDAHLSTFLLVILSAYSIQYLSWNAKSFLESAAFIVHISAAQRRSKKMYLYWPQTLYIYHYFESKGSDSCVHSVLYLVSVVCHYLFTCYNTE